MALTLEWWVYALIAVFVFLGCSLLNFIVKKINDIRLEDRLIRLREKISTNQSTQVQAPVIGETTVKTCNLEMFSVFNKESNDKTTRVNETLSSESSKKLEMQENSKVLHGVCINNSLESSKGNINKAIVGDLEDRAITKYTYKLSPCNTRIIQKYNQSETEMKEWVADLIIKQMPEDKL